MNDPFESPGLKREEDLGGVALTLPHTPFSRVGMALGLVGCAVGLSSLGLFSPGDGFGVFVVGTLVGAMVPMLPGLVLLVRSWPLTISMSPARLVLRGRIRSGWFWPSEREIVVEDFDMRWKPLTADSQTDRWTVYITTGDETVVLQNVQCSKNDLVSIRKSMRDHLEAKTSSGDESAVPESLRQMQARSRQRTLE